MTIAHIINPVKIPSTSDLYIAQPITFESMLRAKKTAEGLVNVELYTAQFEEDLEIIPIGFNKTTNLNRSILDIGIFNIPRKLPLLKDILEKLYEECDAEYLIYTNVDIAIVPSFYITIKKLIDSGYDCFTITRRDLPNSYKSVEQLPLMYKEVGKTHPGHDCFIFKRTLFEKFIHCDACLGMQHVGKYLLFNFFANGQKMHIFRDLHLTFHIGSDRIWRDKRYDDYKMHNFKEINSMLKHLISVNQSILSNPLIHKFLFAPSVSS